MKISQPNRPQESEDIALIGYAAHLPGADGVDEIWDTLISGRCNVGEIPGTRWSSVRYFDSDRRVAGKTYARHAGLIDNVFDFDAAYFGLSPREAEQMDPQQRLLLEVVAQAFDHAGLDPQRLDKERTGVFVGAASSDHSSVCLQDPSLIDAQYMLGNTLSIISNRLSYHWDLRGPSYTVDTACSSGLFALDQARRAITAGDIDTAVVGSVNVLLSPMAFIGFAKSSMLSPTGLCHAFGAEADGYVRGEGAVALILRRADLASVSQDRIRSYLVATGTNSDGRTPGIAMPSSRRQNDLLEHVKERFSISPESLAFIEAHGTGTPVGDPEEARAIGLAYGQERSTPLPIGSAKTNFGHLEPAAGLVGLLKAQLSLEHGVLPASLHADDLNSDIPFEDLGLVVNREARTLPASKEPWHAAVNSFGFGGANAHAVLRQAYTVKPASADHPPALMLTAATEESLRALAGQWHDYAAVGSENLALKTINANTRIARHRHRLCVPGGSPEALASHLGDWLDGVKGAGALQGVANNASGKLGFVFSGNGSQWAGMGRHVLLNDQAFHDSFTEVSALTKKEGAAAPLDLIMSTDLDALLERAPVAQPLLLAIQIALVDSLAERGVRADAVLGHSAGEVAAAYAAGVITRKQAVQIIVARSHTLDQLFNTGSMAAIAADEDSVAEVIAKADLDVDIAAENAPNSITVSGASKDLAHLLTLCRKRRIAGQRLQIEYPYHSRSADPLKPDLLEDLRGITGRGGQIDFYSGCRGGLQPGEEVDAEFWWENARNKVRFRAGVQAMARDGVSVFLEISPSSVLQSYVRDSMDDIGLSGTALGSLEKANAEGIDSTTISLNVLAHGGGIDERQLLSAPLPYTGELPDYPFERKTYRLQSGRERDLFARRAHHALLGGRLDPNATVWTSELSLGRLPWLEDHEVLGSVLLPGTAMLEMFLAAGAELSEGNAVEIRNVQILQPVELSQAQAVPMRMSYDAIARRLTLEARFGDDWTWVAHAALMKTEAEPASVAPIAAGEACPSLYHGLKDLGLTYGPAFARAEAMAASETAVDVTLAASSVDTSGLRLDPMAADAVLHGTFALLERHLEGDAPAFVPTRFGRVRSFGQGEIAGGRLSLRTADQHGVCLDVSYVDAQGRTLAEISELRLSPMPSRRTQGDTFWEERPVPTSEWIKTQGLDVARVARGEDEDPGDLEVVREAIGNRLAWDIVTSPEGQADRRFDVAFAALDALDLVSIGADDKVMARTEAPWPDMPTLINLLIEVQPDASDELQAMLHGMSSDRFNDELSSQHLQAAALDLLEGCDNKLGRVLLVGHADLPVIHRLLDRADYLVVALDTGAEAETLALRFDGAERCLITMLDELPEGTEFDLVFGVGAADKLSSRNQKRIASVGAERAQLVLVDNAPDLFGSVTGRFGETDTVEELDATLNAVAEMPRRVTWRGDAGVTIFEGALNAPKTAQRGVNVLGDGAFAESLRAAAGETETHDATVFVIENTKGDVADRVLAQAEALRSLPVETGTVWVVQPDLEAAGALQGWRRVLANETGRDIRTISVAPGVDPRRVVEVASTSRERELTLMPEGALSPRLCAADVDALRIGPGEKAVLTQDVRGDISTLTWRSAPRPAPENHQIEVSVAATALNYRDIMWAQGLLSSDLLEDGFAGPTLGMECAGIVTEAGADSGFEPGDRVVTFAPDAFSSHVTVCSGVRIPDDMDLKVAASLPAVFVTAEYGLTDLARLRAGEWCLIHGGAGGVGLAAIQVAKRAGARIIATAGSETKRALLRSLGVDHVCDSRSLAFVDEVAAITGGKGVDVVLNSLAGEALEQGVGCLAPFGRFVELGKRDFVANSAIGLRALKDNVSFFAVDVDQLLRHRPEVANDVVARVFDGFEQGDYTPTPVRVYPSDMAVDAFRTMQKSGHVGKILITPPAVPESAAQQKTDIAGTWLVTGGTRGFGYETAKWLARTGAERIWLVSRTGKPESPDALAALEAAGARVEVRAVDLIDPVAVDALMAEVKSDGHGLDGVVHAAAIFDDVPFAEASSDQLSRVVRSKLTGALELDRATRAFNLTHFWVYSSVAARFGNVGQSAYVAANMELEALAQSRQSEGLPGLAIAWGPIGDVGILGRSAELHAVIEQKLGTMTAATALDHLGHALQQKPEAATLTIAPVDWARLRGDLPVVSEPAFEFLKLSAAVDGSERQIDLMQMITNKGEAKARKFLVGILRVEAGKIMNISPSEIDIDRELVDLGFDSLMGMNLKLAIEQRLGQSAPIASIADGMTLSRLAFKIVSGTAQGTTQDITDDMAERHLEEAEMPQELKERILNAAAQ
ncbi:MAG: type I polyketide synthase [Pseudomonadota bacterium]